MNDIEMKDSGIDWIGMVPSDWEVSRFKDVHSGSNVGESIDKEYWSDNPSDTPFYTAGLVPINTSYTNFPRSKLTHPSDLLLARNGTPYVYYPVEDALYTDHIIRCPIKECFDKRYVWYALQLSISNVVVDTVGIPTWSVSLWDEQSVPCPPLPAQRVIAAYLDEKTAAIEAKVKVLGEMLEEYRKLKTAIINRCVTRGVTNVELKIENVKLKDSGVDWIGQVPEGWKVKRIKDVITEQSKKGYPEEPLLAATQSHGVILKSDFENRTVEAVVGLENLKLVRNGDFVISLRSFEGGIEMSHARGIISSAYTVLSCEQNLLPAFFRWLGKSYSFVKLLQQCVTGIREGQNINYSELRRRGIPVPPLAEQREIAAYLDEKCAKIDEAAAIVEKQIDAYKRLKRSLINEVVTGKRQVA